MKAAILGLPQSGRTTLYRYLADIPLSQERLPKKAAIEVEDPRLVKLYKDIKSKKLTTAEFILFDTPGDIESDGRCLEPVRSVDAVIIQLRGFDEGFGKPTPLEDYKKLVNISMEKDMKSLMNRLENLNRTLDKGVQGEERKALEKEKKAVEKMVEQLEKDLPVRMLELTEDEIAWALNYGLITAKPTLIHISRDEEYFHKLDEVLAKISKINEGRSKRVDFTGSTPLFELELEELDEDEQQMFREEAGIHENPRKEIVHHVFEASEQNVFFTTGEKETHSWLLDKGATAIEAAGKIHSDIEQGFIRAEVLSWEDYEKAGSFEDAKKQGLISLEGKDYVVQNGDIILFRFNV